MTKLEYVVKMAGVMVSAELKFRDGQREKICIKVQNDMSSLIHGINDLNVNVSRLLSELVELEKSRGDCVAEEDEEDSDEDEPEDLQNSELQPPAKRSKT